MHDFRAQMYHQMKPSIMDKCNNLTQIAILAPHVEVYPECESLFKKYDVFFDNMIFEGTPMPEKDYVNIINKYKPSKFVLPDVYGNVKETWEMHKQWYKEVYDLSKSMAVIAADIPDVTGPFLDWCQEVGINTIAVPYISEVTNDGIRYGQDRYNLVRGIILQHPKVKIHLLGIEHPSELYLYANMPANVKSADTTLAYSTTIRSYSLRKGEWSKEKIQVKDDFNVDLKLLEENIDYINYIGWSS